LAKLGSFEKKTILVLLRIQTRLMMGIVKNRKSILEINKNTQAEGVTFLPNSA